MLHHHSKVEVFVHMVWTTKNRELLLAEPKIERAIYRCIEQETQRLRCPTMALGGTADHLHLLIPLHSTVTIARLAQAVKGVSSNFANDELGFRHSFDWQKNYGAFSVSEWNLDTVRAYIANQKQHHRDNTQIDEWETTFETVEYPD